MAETAELPRYIAIKRHALAGDNEYKGPVPSMLRDFIGLDLETYTRPDAPGLGRIPVNYIIVPIHNMGEWDGLPLLDALAAEAKTNPPVRKTYSTLDLPGLTPVIKSETIAALNVTSNDFAALKKVAGDRITEVSSVQELLIKYGELALQQGYQTKWSRAVAPVAGNKPRGGGERY